jgi:peptidyl-prolyl cis-trans isomerase SurA
MTRFEAMPRRLALSLLLLLILAVPIAVRAQETRIAAVVNDEAISMADLRERMKLIMASSNFNDTPELRQRLARQVLRGLIDEKLEMQEAKRLGINVPESDVNDAFGRLEAQNKMPKGGLDQFFKARGIDRATLVDQITASLAWGRVIRATMSQQAAVSDEEVDAALARLKEDEHEPKSRVGEIFLAVDTPQQDEDVHRFADRLFEQIRQGAGFAQLAQQFSQSAAAAVGGDIGYVTPSELGRELGEAVEKLQPGEVAPPLRGAGGYYILAVIDRRRPGQGSPDDKVSLSQVMFPMPPNASPADQQRVRAQAEAVSKQAKSCGELTQIGRQQAPQTSGELGFVRVADLPPELRPVVAKLKIAEASPPVPLRGGVGVLMVCDREGGGGGGLPTREEVSQNLSQGKFDTLAQRYLRDLRRQAFVDIRG